MRSRLLLTPRTLLVIVVLFCSIVVVPISTLFFTYPVENSSKYGTPDAEFAAVVGPVDDLNRGIEIVLMAQMVAVNATPTAEQLRDIPFVVFNHADEPIEFPDMAYGVQLYIPDLGGANWQLMPLTVRPVQQAWVLPARVETLDANFHNAWSLLSKNLPAFPSGTVRIYVHGQGQHTKLTYGAYLDINQP